jgi:hypothetical protein
MRNHFLRASAGKLFNPFAISTALWLSAKDTSNISIQTGVSAWGDRKGNGLVYTQSTIANQPAYSATGLNGLPAIENVSADFLSIGTTSLGRDVSGITVAIVGSYPVGAAFTNNASDFSIFNGINTSQTRFITSPNVNNTNTYGIGGRRLDADSFVFIASNTGSLASRGSPWIRVAQRNYAAATASHWTNGTKDLADAAIGSSGKTSNTNSLNSFIFAGATSAPNGSKLSEIIVIHSAISDSEVERLIGYLHWEWNYASALPNSFAYRFSPP